MMPSIRLLPVLILVAGLSVTLKLGGLWERFSAPGETAAVGSAIDVAFSQAQAQEEPAPAAEDLAPADAEDALPLEDGLEDGLDFPDDGLDGDVGGPPPADLSGFGDDPTLFTQEEIDLLQNLSARREALDRRERELDERQSFLAAAEARIDRKIDEMKALQTHIEGLIVEKDEAEEKKIVKLVKVYEKMKAKDAAKIWNDLDMEILLEVATRMREANTAAVMARMDPARARSLTAELARREEIDTVP